MKKIALGLFFVFLPVLSDSDLKTFENDLVEDLKRENEALNLELEAVDLFDGIDLAESIKEVPVEPEIKKSLKEDKKPKDVVLEADLTPVQMQDVHEHSPDDPREEDEIGAFWSEPAQCEQFEVDARCL